MTFSLDLSKAIGRVKGNSENIIRGTLIELSNRIIKRTPVGNPELWIYNAGTKDSPRYVDYIAYRGFPNGYVGGSLRGAWQASKGSPDFSLSKRVQDSESGAASAAAFSVADTVRFGDTFYLTNPLPYANRVERGWSTQAPVGMVRVTVMEAQRVLDTQ